MTDQTTEATFHISDILRIYASALQIPVIIILIGFVLCVVMLLGWMIGEMVTERRHLKVHLSRLLDQMNQKDGNPVLSISESGLLKRQKEVLLELTRHPNFSSVMREALAVRLVEQEQARYDRIVKYSELLARLGPIFGLLGTLIPLGPGIIALGQGDTYTLSTSLLTAFDTTVAGLTVAAVATVISTVRRGWYKEYMSMLEVMAQSVLELEEKDGKVRYPYEAV